MLFALGWILVLGGGSALFAILSYRLHCWLNERETRKSVAYIKQMEERYWRKMKEASIRYVEELYKEVGKR